MVIVDQARDRRRERLLADVPVGTPGQGVSGQVRDRRELGQPEVAGLGEEAGIEIRQEGLCARLAAADVLERAAELRPLIDLNQQIGQLDPRQAIADARFQLLVRASADRVPGRGDQPSGKSRTSSSRGDAKAQVRLDQGTVVTPGTLAPPVVFQRSGRDPDLPGKVGDDAGRRR